MELNELQKERIRRGAALLDSKLPDWPKRVITDNLDIDSFSLCVVCQVFGNFYDGLQTLGLAKGHDEECLKAASEHGFYPHADEKIPDVAKMTDEDFLNSQERALKKTEYWKELITQRSTDKWAII